MTVAHNPFIASEVLVAERLLEAFDAEDPRFGDYFEAADRVTLGAMTALATLAMRDLAVQSGRPLADVRRSLRARVAEAAATTQAGSI